MTLQEQYDLLECEVNEIFKEIKPLQNKLHKKRTELDKLKERLDRQTIKNIKVTDWNYVLFEDGNNSNIRNQYSTKQLEKLHLSSFGYFPKLKQRHLIFSLKKDDPELPKVVNGIKQILPFMKAISEPNKNGKIFQIRNDDNEYGIVELLINKDEIKIISTSFRRVSLIEKFETLTFALQYISKHYYYS